MSKDIVIIKYNAGNIRSVDFALRRLGYQPTISDDPKTIAMADKVIFPGVGEASSTMKVLKNSGMDNLIKSLHQPFLGICLGMQVMCEFSTEGQVETLGLFPITVDRFSKELKVPHVGWNSIEVSKDPIFYGLPENPYVYFVHSYYAAKSPFAIATCHYGIEFSASLRNDNFYGLQFHPEKSGAMGLQILKNFIEL